jgi:hypothetical protein
MMLGTSSDVSWSQQEKLRILFEKAHAVAAEEFRLANELLHHARMNLKRRDRRNGAAATAAAASQRNNTIAEDDMSDGEDDDEDEPLAVTVSKNNTSTNATAPSASSTGAGGRVPVLNRNDKLNIWYHDAHSVLPVGAPVAALVDEHSIPPLWIQCSIRSYRSGHRAKYEVIDEDPGDVNEDEIGAGGEGSPQPARQKRYLLDPRKILPLPSLQSVPLSARKEFPKGTRVLAVFPTGGITVLYPAQVVAPPKKRKNNEYLLMFDDDEGQLCTNNNIDACTANRSN